MEDVKKRTCNEWKTVINMGDTNSTISIITLNVSVNMLIKRDWQSGRKHKTQLGLPQETHLKYKETDTLKIKDVEGGTILALIKQV